MAEKTPDTPDLEEPATKAASAEDRKAASALAKLDSTTLQDSDATKPSANVDAAAVSEAMARLEGKAAGGGLPLRPVPQKAVVAKSVKVDQADVALLVDQLDMTKVKATELLKQNEGDAVRAMRAYVSTPW